LTQLGVRPDGACAADGFVRLVGGCGTPEQVATGADPCANQPHQGWIDFKSAAFQGGVCFRVGRGATFGRPDGLFLVPERRLASRGEAEPPGWGFKGEGNRIAQ
jgi:hypothetical protein